MAPSIVAIITVVMLAAWHLRTRRHSHWQASSDGRFYIFCGYPAVAIAVYWLSVSPTDTTWEWVVGNLWALAAAISFVVGFNALNDAPKQEQKASSEMESLSDDQRSDAGSTDQPRRRPGPQMSVY